MYIINTQQTRNESRLVYIALLNCYKIKLTGHAAQSTFGFQAITPLIQGAYTVHTRCIQGAYRVHTGCMLGVYKLFTA